MAVARLRVYGVLLLGIIAVSFASIIIALLLEEYAVPAPVIAAARLVFSSAVLAPVFWLRPGSRRSELGRVRWPLVILAALLLAAHFATWVESLNHTTVASSVVLVALNPIFAATLAPLLLKERVTRRQWAAVGLGLVGAVVIAGPAISRPGNTTGNLLAIAGALFAAGYLIAGRSLRSGLSLLTYVYLVYTVCALLLVILVLLARVPCSGYRWQAYGLMLLLAFGPQLLGHTSFNYALRYLSAPAVAMGVLGEPIGTILLSWLLLCRVPRAYELAGGILICAGIYLAALQGRSLLGRFDNCTVRDRIEIHKYND
ncbi:MAG: DMT family transporter [candidate division WOR-3 bacterium]